MSLQEKSEQYCALLESTCKTLSTSRIVQTKAYDVSAGAARVLDFLRLNRKAGKETFTLSLEPNWRISIDSPSVCGPKGATELHFGGLIRFEEKCLTQQVLTVVILFWPDEDHEATDGRPALKAGECYVVRRFHFDFDRSVIGQNKPLAHVQIGGRLRQDQLVVESEDVINYDLFDQLAEPRLPWAITDLAIVMHTFLRQFPSDLDEVIAGRDWRERVMESEKHWLMDFYKNIIDMMDSQAERDCLFDHICELTPFDR